MRKEQQASTECAGGRGVASARELSMRTHEPTGSTRTPATVTSLARLPAQRTVGRHQGIFPFTVLESTPRAGRQQLRLLAEVATRCQKSPAVATIPGGRAPERAS